jgi:hypothetical protein
MEHTISIKLLYNYFIENNRTVLSDKETVSSFV